MSEILTDLSSFFTRTVSVFSTFNWFSDTLDILLLALVVYYLVKVIKDSRAMTLAKGLILLVVVYVVVLALGMQSSSYLLSRVLDNILVILVVIFSPELRKILERMGNTSRFSSILSIFTRSNNQKALLYNDEVARCVNSVCKAAQEMSDDKIGALIIFEKNTPLGEIIDTGTLVDARISSSIIGNIFYPKAPLHDGAAVIRNNRLYAAGCILPLTSRNNDVAKELGTRHRAAIGMSEQSDAMVLVVSEETGAMSIAEGGMLLRNLTDGEVREMLLNFLQIPMDLEQKKKTLFRKKKGGND